MRTDHVHGPIRPRVTLEDPDEPLEMIGFTIARYKFACKWLRETDRVLEVGCGAGFGANFLSRHSARVVAIDSDAEAIAACRGRYRRENIEFVAADLLSPSFAPPWSFDAVVCLEVIEHMDRSSGEALARCMRDLLAPGGILLLSTPRARSDRSLSRQRHHPYEYSHDALRGTLDPLFARVMVFCQNDELIYAGHPSTAWNFVAVAFR
ncbi:MAG: class I SAM-dependent methyltransferase [Planctomycetes bacterium]|nr:class I SAM-dependent methyltransferase [Planctomycetota bacterium]